MSAGDATTGVTGLHADILLNFKNISLQKFTRLGDILGFFELIWLERILHKE